MGGVQGQNEKKFSNARAYTVRKYNAKTYKKQKLVTERPRIATLLISDHFFWKKWNSVLGLVWDVNP